MSIGRGSVVVVAVAVAGALAVAGIALGSGSSTASFSFRPHKVPKKHYKKGKLFVHTHTDYTNGGTKTDRAQLYFDDDLKIKTKRIPRCNKARISGNIDMAGAMAKCGRAKIGSGKAQANVRMPGDAKACVLAFNGKPSGRKPTILLFTRVQVTGPIDCTIAASNHNGNVTVLLEGVLKGAKGDYGTQLDINHITSVAAFPLRDFRVTVKRGRYVSARCHDRNKKWNMKAKFTYLNPSATQKVNSSETCRVKH
jgi:hypothetical protein